MAWALPAFKSNSRPLLITLSPTSNMISKQLSRKLIPLNSFRYPIKIQSSSFASGSSWSQFYSGTGPRVHVNKNLLLAPVPLASCSTLVATIQELDSDDKKLEKHIPMDLTVNAAWAPKRPRSQLPPWCKADCGEDAFFSLLVNNLYCLGVADGVGGWSDVGVDPSQFAWELMNQCRSHCEALGMVGKINPLSVLSQAYHALLRSKKVRAGSSTACITVIDTDTGILQSVNLGDSGYVILRQGKVAYRSAETTHYFNAPYQLAVIPPELEGRGHINNVPEDGTVTTLQLEYGDLVVLGTDGLFDNLFSSDIETEAEATCPADFDKLLEKPSNSQPALKAYTNAFAGALVRRARTKAQDRKAETPFSTEAQKVGLKYKGGKMDDITVVVALVTTKSAPKSKF